MRVKLFFFLLFSVIPALVNCQTTFCTQTIVEMNFDDGNNWTGCDTLIVDSSTNSQNLWVVSSALKTNINQAESFPNIIVTDSIYSYPTNDTSSFVIKHVAGQGFEHNYTGIFSGYYSVNSDSLNDYGIFEFSPDNGITWIDITKDTIYYSLYDLGLPRPVLTGNSNGWRYFAYDFSNLMPYFSINAGDTIIFKFTFISDNNSDSLDGLAFDSFSIEDYFLGVEDISIKPTLKIYPNPCQEALSIQILEYDTFKNGELIIYNILGEIIYKTIFLQNQTIDVSFLPPGVYNLTLKSENSQTSEPFVKIVN
ncbi:MAG: T9SS type A sorting domain-containing protein [Bacteroidia bacterium]|nr:T9SS type A sorting domain-containing protein [Bacteroidia bacterium]